MTPHLLDVVGGVRARQIFKPELRFGLWGVSLGNEFNKHSDKDAETKVGKLFKASKNNRHAEI